MTVATEVAAAYRAGRASWSAAAAGNPWSGIGPTARERVLAQAWRRGRCHGRPHRMILEQLDALDPLT